MLFLIHHGILVGHTEQKTLRQDMSGYGVCNDAIIMQKFGDKRADSAAKTKLAKVFPNHSIEQVAIDGIASGGGSIHCATQQEPKV